MGGGDVFPTEMPEDPSQPMVPLDADTAERLLSGRLDPDDAPPGYADVARLLQAAAGPAEEAELSGEAAAVRAFDAAQRGRSEVPGRRGRMEHSGFRVRSWGRAAGPLGGRAPVRGRGGVRGRLVVLALAAAVAVGGVGVWTAGGGPFPRELGSPSGGPAAGGSGSGVPASQGYRPGADGAGSLRPAGPGLGPSAGAAQVTGDRPPSVPSAREPATARHGGDVTSHGGGSDHGAKPNRPARQPRPKPEKPEPKKAKEPREQAAKGPKASESRKSSD
jgi:hypothetical protein